MSKKVSEKKSPDQIGLSFKNNEEEQKLYTWLKQKLNPGIYLKEIAYREYLIDTGKLQYAPTQPLQTDIDTSAVESAPSEPVKTEVAKNPFGFNDDEEE